MGSAIIGNTDPQVWKLLGVEIEDKKVGKQKDEDEKVEKDNSNIEKYNENKDDANKKIIKIKRKINVLCEYDKYQFGYTVGISKRLWENR